MKPAGLFLFVTAGFVAVAFSAETSPALLSRETKSRVREGLPTYHAPALKPASDTTDLSSPTDPDVLVLPKLTITEKRLPRDATDRLMSTKNFNRKMENLDLDDLAKDSSLEAFLNGFAIPLFSPSRVERGKALYRGKELDRLADLLSPEEAKCLNGMYDDLALIVGRRAPKRR